jgi:hypothetical protein
MTLLYYFKLGGNMAHELKPVMNNIIHRPMTNLEALKSMGSPKAKINAVKESLQPSLVKNSGVDVQISQEAKAKMKASSSQED